MSKITTNKSFMNALASLSLQQQRLVGARFIKNVLELTKDKHIIHAQSIAVTSDAKAEDLLDAYHSVHTSYVKTNPRSNMHALVREKQAEHPESGRNMPVSNRMVVDLPAALGPRSPKISPELIDKLS